MKNRAYSLLEIKAVDEEARIITGVASTPVTDRAGDIVEPKGAKFTLPIPLLWQHRSDSPIGHVTAAKITADGIEITAQLAKTDEPGDLKNLLDKAWQAIKLQLVRGLSIGFKPIEMTDIAGTWGQRFTKWEWLELSAVTIPANADATIQSVKSFDAEQLAATGQERPGVTPPRDRGSVKLIKPKPQGGAVKTASEQIAAFEATRAAKAARMEEIQNKASAEGRTKDAAEQEEFDTLRAELKSIDRELVDLGDMEAEQARKAKPVEAVKTVAGAAEARAPQITVKAVHQPAPGIRLARAVKCIGLAHKRHRDVSLVAKEMYPDDELVQKTAVAAGTTGSGNWAAPLVGEETSAFADFVEFLRPLTILGKFGAGGIPSLRRVPFRTPLIGQTDGGDGYWVGEGKPKPLTKFAFERKTLEPLKVANIAVLTEEVLAASSPSAEMIVRDSLAAALRERLDLDFINPDKAAVAGISPASITHGLTPIPATGSGSADDVRTDIRALMAEFIAANNAPTSGVWIMSATTALGLSLLMNALGQPEFPGISMNGGTLFGMPVIVSEYVTSDDYGAIVALANASDIYLADDGGIAVDVSREASLQMDDSPTTQDANSGTGTSLVSLWQTNSVGFRAERTIDWARRRTSAVALLSEVAWGQA